MCTNKGVGKLKITINHEETMYIEGLRSQVEEDNMTENFITKLIEVKNFESVVNILTIILLFLKRKIKSYKIELDDLASVRRRSKQILYGLARPDKEKIKSIQSQFDIREDENGTYLLTRPFDIEKKIINFEYVLLDGSTIVGKSILKSHHIHVSSVEREIHVSSFLFTNTVNKIIIFTINHITIIFIKMNRNS